MGKTAAVLYKKYLVGKRFLYVLEGRYIEAIFKSANSRHLTGVATNLSANSSYVPKKSKLRESICFYLFQDRESLEYSILTSRQQKLIENGCII